MEAVRDSLVPYWLRSVRIGIIVTILTIGALLVFWAAPGHGPVDPVTYGAVLAGAVIGVAVVRLLPWERMFEGRLGVWGLYAWSCLDILLISVAVYGTGGGRSEMYLVYGLTTVFFGAGYPPKGQAGLLAFTMGCYVAVVGLTGWEIGAAVLLFRLAMLSLLALLTSFLARELMRLMAKHLDALRESQRWADLLSTVAAAGRGMTLDHARVLDVVVDSVNHLGFEASNICVLDQAGETYRVAHPRGIPASYAEGVHPADRGMVGLVRDRGETVTVGDYAELADAPAALRDEGFRSVMASPILVEGKMAAVLVGGTRATRRITPHELEAFELLAAQAGLALENARRFEEERRAVERLAELDRLKSDFLSTVSHELRTPITVIEGMGLTLQQRWDELDEDTRRELLQGLNANARTLDEIITSLLDFSRLESGAPRVAREPLDLEPLLGSVAGRLEPLFEGRGLSVRLRGPLLVEADAMLIERAVENLLSNAAKHTEPGARVLLEAYIEDGTAVVSVADDGPGISPDDLRHIGDRFFRGGETNTRRTKGLGLGLASCGRCWRCTRPGWRSTAASGWARASPSACPCSRPSVP
ncbi:MAG: GAF domain-containing protein [Actinobacteria bacterium]|nr:GAF domain-containing protein [Actinomycetota bacterium]